MRFVRPYLESIDGVSIYPIVSILIFFALFLFIGIRVYKMDKSYVNKMSQAPLLDNENEEPINQNINTL